MILFLLALFGLLTSKSSEKDIVNTSSLSKKNVKAYVKKNHHSTMSSLFKYDQNLFERNFDSVEARILFYTHSLEKGLSHSEIRPGFGLSALKNLRKVMDRSKSKSSAEYNNALAVLKEYFDIHKDYDISEQKKILGEKIIKEVHDTKWDFGGSKIITKDSKSNNNYIAFDRLIQNRYSVREYDDTPVTEENIMDVIRMAQKTPSACNRQSPRVAIIQDPKIIRETMKLQGGVHGYKNPPCLLLVTADNRAYIGPNERHQGYIDGGLFVMSLLLGLEYKALAAVPLHTMFVEKTDAAMRQLLKIPDSECLISFVAIGNFKEINKVAKSFRYPLEKIIRRV